MAIQLTASDIDGDSLTYSAQSNDGTVSLAGSTLTFTPAANFHGEAVITVLANDGTVNSAPGTVTITVAPVNDLPAVTLLAAEMLIDEGSAIELMAVPSDVEGISKVEFYSGDGSIGEKTTQPWSINWDPAAGSYTLKARVTDTDNAAADSASITLSVNGKPVVDAGEDRAVSMSTTLQGSATDDQLPGPSLAYEWTKVIGPGSVTFGTPSQLQTTAVFSAPGEYVVRLSASDSRLTGFDEVRLTVAVPALATVQIESPSEGTRLKANQSVPVLVTVDDPENRAWETILLMNNEEVARKTSSPYEFAWTPTQAGVAELRASVQDGNGTVIESDNVQFRVLGPAVPQSLLMVSGQEVVNGHDVRNLVTKDGVTWTPAAVITAAFPVIAGTQAISVDGVAPAFFSARFRRTFHLPEDYAQAAFEIFVHADNVAYIYLNGTRIGGHKMEENLQHFVFDPERFATVDPANFRAGENVLEVELYNLSSVTALDCL